DIYYRFSLLTPYRVSHFYAGNFYVYKYAIGQLGAIINAKRIHDKDDKQLARLYTFLESGTSKSPLETVKLLGIDLSKDAPWQEAQKIVDEWIEEYIKIAKELKYITK
ncbi:MAG: oligoendopeptidase F, partial [Mycoplasmataceae bacterium]|nr:oligoendopeptidase F [Mycoplasmataceae bacterium]